MVVCTDMVQPSTTRQKRQKKDKNDRKKVTKTHHILQDKNEQYKTKLTKTKSQKHKTTQITVQYSDSNKYLQSTVPQKH